MRVPISFKKPSTPKANQTVQTLGPRDRRHLDEAVSVLAESFQNAPQFAAVCSDETKRAKMLSIFFGIALDDALRHGHVSVALVYERVVGVAVWLPPGREVMTPARQVHAALPMMQIFFAVPRAFPRLVGLGSALSTAHPKEPHWYLVALGVAPTAQGQGFGSRLVQEGVTRAEKTGHGCYLETMLEKNVRLYKKYSFEVIRREKGSQPGGPPVWFMWRSVQGVNAARRAPRQSTDAQGP